MELITDLAKHMVMFIKRRAKDWAKEKLESQPKVLKIMKELGISKLESNHGSIYSHALLELAAEAEPPELIMLFADKEANEAFQHDRLANSKGQAAKDSQFQRVLMHQFHHNDSHSFVRGYFNSKYSRLTPFIEQFKESYDRLTLQTAQPAILKMHNDMTAFMIKQLEEAERRSFSYQARQAMDDLVSDFEKDFLMAGSPKEPYIDLNAETRVYGHANPTNHHTGDKPAIRPPVHTDIPDAEWQSQCQSVEYRPFDSFINDWLADENRNFLLIIGEYGTGKTTFLRHMAHDLCLPGYAPHPTPASKHHGTEPTVRDSAGRIPLFFPLRDFEKNLESFILTRLNRFGIEDINYPRFLERLGDGQLLLLFDGFDEMTQRIDGEEKKRNFNQIRRLIDSRSRSKIILTVRQEYFRSIFDLEEVIKHKGKTNYEVIHLLPFDDQQVRQFLYARTKQPEYYWKLIQKTFDLIDLAKRPVLLQLIVDYLPKVIEEKGDGQSVNASDLYFRCIADELDRKSNNLRMIIPNRHRLVLLERLAVWMFINDTLSFDIKLLEDELNFGQYFSITNAWEIERYLNEFLTFTFLIREGENRFRMSHKSFRDYLTATAFAREINSGQVEYFGKKPLTKEINHFILEQKPSEDKLLNLTNTARVLSENKIFQGGNAAGLILLIDNAALKGRDLSHCQLWGVNFSGSDLRGTDFSNGELKNCIFNESILDSKCQNVNVENSKLSIYFLKVKDLSFLALFKSLSDLRVENSDPIDITALMNMKKLTHLKIGYNKLTNIAPLKRIKRLTYLELQSNQLTDVTPLAELKNLTTLWLDRNQISDVTPLVGLNGLTELDLSSNQLSDISPLSELKGLTKVSLSNNRITDLSPLSELKELRELSLANNQLTDISHLLELGELTKLDISGNHMVDLSPLVDLKGLNHLNINNMKITDLKELKDLRGLEHLELDGNQLTDLTPLTEFKRLISLSLENSQLRDVSALAKLKRLTRLRLSNNRLTDVTPLAELKNLKVLFLSNNCLTHARPLWDLKALITLYLRQNLLTDVKPLTELKCLINLHLGHNQLNDITPLSKLKDLRWLYLDDKQKSLLTQQINILEQEIPELNVSF